MALSEEEKNYISLVVLQARDPLLQLVDKKIDDHVKHCPVSISIKLTKARLLAAMVAVGAVGGASSEIVKLLLALVS